MYTVSLFREKDPSTLLVSIDWVHATKPQRLVGAPDCLVIRSEVEEKDIPICLNSDSEVTTWLEAFLQFGKCNKGIDITVPKKCSDDEGVFVDTAEEKVAKEAAAESDLFEQI